MPNAGGLYRGCDACRRRKVKCDQTYPSCRRCIKKQVSCPGVQRIADVMFRDETLKVMAKAEQPSLKQPTFAQQLDMSIFGVTPNSDVNDSFNITDFTSVSDLSSTNSFFSHDDGDAQTSTPTLLLDLYQPPKADSGTPPSNFISTPSPWLLSSTDIMTEYFFEQLVMPNTWLAGLPELYSHACEHSAIRHAIQAASMFLLGNQSGDHVALANARQQYGRCLQLINTALGDVNEKIKDETICSVLVVHLISDITGERSTTSGSHIKACKSLVTQRSTKQDSVFSNYELANSLVIQSQPYVLKHYQDWAGLYAEQLCSSASARPAAAILRQCLAIGRLRNAIANLTDLQVGRATSRQSLWLDALEEAEEIDQQLEEWEAGMTGRWRRCHATHLLSNTTIEVDIEYYSDIQVGKVWNQCRCARISLHEAILQILEQLISVGVGEQLMPKVRRSARVITSMLSAICDSIPFHLQQVDSRGELMPQTSMRVLGGEHLLWPLEVVFTSPWSTDSQRDRARKTLEEIGTGLGLRQASRAISLKSLTPAVCD